MQMSIVLKFAWVQEIGDQKTQKRTSVHSNSGPDNLEIAQMKHMNPSR